MKRVLVTGASGFVGRHVLPALTARGFEVRALGRTAPDNPDVAFHPVDLLDRRAVEALTSSIRASHLLHLAWYAEPGSYWSSPVNLDWTAASLMLVRSFCEAGGRRAVGVGTCAEYAWGPPRLSEDMSCAPATLYGAAKDATRRVLVSYAGEHGISFAWGRLFFLYGPGERRGRLVSDAIHALRAGERFPTSSGDQQRDFSYIADVGEALAALLDSDTTGPVNIGSGIAVPVRHVLQKIGDLMNRADLINFGSRALSPNEPASIEADVSRLHNVVGFLPQFDLEAGLRATLKADFEI